MSKNFQNFLKFSLPVAIGMALLGYVFSKIDLNHFLDLMLRVNYLWILLSMVLSLVSHWLRALRWNLLYKTLQHNPPVLDSFFAIMVGYMANWALPRLGEVARCTIMKKTNRIPMSSSIGSVITERIVDVVFLGFLVLLCLCFELPFFQIFLNPFLENSIFTTGNIWWYAGMVALAIGLCWVLFWISRNTTLRWPQYIIAFLTSVGFGIRGIWYLKEKWYFLLLSLAMWILYAFTMYVCFLSMPETQELSVMVAFIVTVMSAVSMMVPVQGGIGVYHMLVSTILTYYGLEKEPALFFATVANASQFVIMVATGAVGIFYVSVLKKQKINVQ